MVRLPLFPMLTFGFLDRLLQPGLYLEHVARRLREERDRIRFYLDESTNRRLTDILEQQLITRHLDNLLKQGLSRNGRGSGFTVLAFFIVRATEHLLCRCLFRLPGDAGKTGKGPHSPFSSAGGAR